MKSILRRTVCLLAVVAMIFSGTGAFYVHADTDAIKVVVALSDVTLYSGNNLKEALAAAERGSIITISNWNFDKITESMELDVEVMLVGYDFIAKQLSRKIQILLTGNGKIFCTDEISKSHIGAKYSYSKVKSEPESNGFVYFLETQAPSLEGKTLTVAEVLPSDLYGVKVDEEAQILYLDGLYSGMPTESFTSIFSMEAENADGVDVSFKDAVKNDGASCVATGTKLIVTAANYDYDGVISREYQIVVVGDVNGNGRIDSADASLILRHANGVSELTGLALSAADTDNDGAVTAADAEILCQKYIRGG